MWFFRSVELLPRPSFFGLAPSLAMLAVWFLFEGMEPVVAGWPVQPLWLALAAGYGLGLSIRAPRTLARVRALGYGFYAVWTTLGALAAALILGFMLNDARAVQVIWLAGWLVYALGLLVSLLAFTPQELTDLPLRWAGDHPFARDALWLVMVRMAVVALGASWLMTRGTLTDWLVFVTLGRIALFYLFEWITVLMVLTRPRDD